MVLPPLVLLPVRALPRRPASESGVGTVASCVCSENRFATDEHHKSFSILARALGRPDSAVPAGEELKQQNSELWESKRRAWLAGCALGGKICTRTAQIHVSLRPPTTHSPPPRVRAGNGALCRRGARDHLGAARQTARDRRPQRRDHAR